MTFTFIPEWVVWFANATWWTVLGAYLLIKLSDPGVWPNETGEDK